MEQRVLLKVEGMDCANCASTINRSLSKEGLKEVHVDFMSGEVTFNKTQPQAVKNAINSIHRLGYSVVGRSDEGDENNIAHEILHTAGKTNQKFYVSLLFTIPLVLHMFLPDHLFHEPLFQLILSIPVMYIGIMHFGKSAFYSIRAGVPNMDVLIFIGSFASFIYSLIGLIKFYGHEEVHRYMFFETGATIITLVLLGNLIEQKSVKQTSEAISQLQKLQPLVSKKVVSTGQSEKIIESKVGDLVLGDIIQLNTGDKAPLDGTIMSGSATVDESMLTGESNPLNKKSGDQITGGTIIENGSIRFVVEHIGKDTVLSKIIELVKNAQLSKPEIQKIGDRVSAVFVPVVLSISILTFFISMYAFAIPVSTAMMSSIAVLVISCPCAMGLATPTAVMVGLGRAARNGILIKGGSTIEHLAGIKTIVFDKTGTITTGNFKIKNINCIGENEDTIRNIIFSMEKNSSHPIARALVKELENSSKEIVLKNITEDRGIGINAEDEKGNLYSAGSFQMVKHFHDDLDHDIFLLKNNILIATLDMEDEIKPHVTEVVASLKGKGINVVLLSGDRKRKCDAVAEKAGITVVFFEKLPKEKLEILSSFEKEGRTAMVGDGINDAPALAQATVGISISNASDTAIQSSQVILLDKQDMSILLRALMISKATYSTIKQNLFWALLYNVIAIPVAAFGLLSPMIGALSMAFSDVIVIGNSLRLRIRKLE